MTLPAAFGAAFPIVLAAMGLVAAVEAAIPLHARERWSRAHLVPNLALTGVTFATNLVLNGALLAALVALRGRGFAPLDALALPPLLAGAIAVALLDLSFYLAHRLMHERPAWWRFHAVHHSDPTVDVTTALRQHPVEGLIRYAFLAAATLALAPSPAAFGVYRVASALFALLEHANVRAPVRIDRWLARITTWPHMHKVHHSRVPVQTDTNYGNLLSCWDRLFGTFTPSREGTRVRYGLEGLDGPATQSTLGLLALPWAGEGGAPRGRAPAGRGAAPSRGILAPGNPSACSGVEGMCSPQPGPAGTSARAGWRPPSRGTRRRTRAC
jgi:sterol desaturase/sphingolipid hydroxylase (fatty acid hydroxylase superfamily)